MSGGSKLTRQPTAMKGMSAVGVSEERVWMSAVLEIAGAAGLVVGLF